MGTAFGVLFAGACLATVAWLFHHYLVRLHDARRWLSSGALLVDVDSPFDFYRHHPRKAVSVPLEHLAQRAVEFGPRDTAIVVFGHSWLRGARAVHDLREMGFSAVMNAAGLRTREAFGGRHRQSAEALAQPPHLVELDRVGDADLLPVDADAPRNGGTHTHDTSMR